MILHINNVANVGGNICQKQRESGIDSRILSFRESYTNEYVDLQYDIDHKFNWLPRRVGDAIKLSKKFNYVRRMQKKLELIHFHYGSLVHNYNLLPDGLDMFYWHNAPTPIIVHYHGSDIRWKNNENSFTNRLADKILVSSPDLLHHAPSESEWLPRSLDMAKIDPIYPDTTIKGEIQIVHAPTRRHYKGTQIVIDTVEMLRSKNYPINLQIIENMNHQKAIQEYSKADIVIDWVNSDFGIYGMFGIEAMSLGKPVLASTNNLPHGLKENCPVIDVNEDNLTNKITQLIENPDMIRANGIKCRQFAENKHNINDTVDRLNEIYSSMLNGVS